MFRRYLWLVFCVLAVSGIAAARSGGVAEPAPLPQKAATKAVAPTGKVAPQVQVRVISIPLQECAADDNEGMNAVRAFIDPATGELRAPTPEEEAALARAIAPKAARHAQAATEAMVTASGNLIFDLGEEGMQDVVVRIAPDGKLVFLCTPRSETPKALTRPLAPKKDAAPEEKE